MDPRKINRTGVPLDQNNLGVCVVYYFIMLIYYMLYLTYHYVEYTDLGKLKFSEKNPLQIFVISLHVHECTAISAYISNFIWTLFLLESGFAPEFGGPCRHEYF